LLCRGETLADEGWASRLIDLVQSRGVAVLVADDSELAERLGSDGIHLGVADTLRYAKARELLGASASIGVGCGLSRHDAMRVAEIGADYVAFGSPESSIDAVNQIADLTAWWAEIFVVPCVAWNIDRVDDAERLAKLGADFVAPSARLWQEAGVAGLAEMASVIGQVRRAA
jgi:thiamine-phosphate pyrophosphorylase